MSAFKRIFQKQDWHFAWLALLLVSVNFFARRFPFFLQGQHWGISSNSWLWIGILAAVLHQIYVMLIWRTQLETEWLTKYFPRIGFLAYLADFTILMVSRFAAIIFLAIANQGYIHISDHIRLSITVLLALPFSWLLYSLFKFFGYKRAAGEDHFDHTYRNQPLVREGAFQYFQNAIYTLGPLGLYMPGILLASPAALVLAFFNHIYIWIHYYCTELPDIKRIYGSSRH